MSTVKRVSGEYTIQSIGASDPINLISPFVNITGNLTVTGNAVLVGNINADKIFNGTTSIEIPVTSGNANVTIGGTANVAVFSTTGAFITGLTSVTGNVQGGNLRTAGQVSATGNVSGGNLTIATGNIVLTQTSGATTSQMIRFQDANTAIAIGANVGSIEWYTSDATTPGARITARIQAVYEDVTGNANIQIQTGSTATPSTRITVIGSSGNVGIANAAPLHTLAITGNAYVSTFASVVGNINAGNLISANLAQSANMVVTGAISTPSWTTTGVGIRTVASTYTDSSTAISGTATTNHIHVLSQPTLAATNATVTTTAASTLYIAAAPAAGTNMTITNPYALYIAAGNTYSGANISATGNITGGNVNSNDQISATGNVNAANFNATQNFSTTGNVRSGTVTASGNIVGANISISSNMSGTGIGVENIVWQSTDATVASATPVPVGSLAFAALANQAYKFNAYIPMTPSGSMTTGFSVNFSAGTCQYTVELPTTATSAFTIGYTSSVSNAMSSTATMTGTDLRAARITGTFYHTANTTVTINAQNNTGTLTIKTGSNLSYTRIG